MDQQVLKDTFLEMVQDIYHAEHQIVKSLPLMIEAASYQDLKLAFTKHLKETKNQVTRLENVFKLLGVEPKEKRCHAIKGLLKEGQEIIEKTDLTPAVKDACLIMAAQKIEHYEIATYGSLCSFIRHLSKVIKDQKLKQIFILLNENLKEEQHTDEALTQLADGTEVMEGINDEAEKEILYFCM